MRSRRTVPQMFWRCVATVGFGICAAIATMLAVSSLVMTNLAQLGTNPNEIQVYGTLLNHPEWILASWVAVVVVLVLFWASARLGRRHPAAVITAAFAFVALIQAVWILVQLPLVGNDFSDASQLLEYARELVSGDLASFYPASQNVTEMQAGQAYLTAYPYQSGLLLLDALFVRLFGTNCMLALAIAGSLLNLLAFATVLRTAQVTASLHLSGERLGSFMSCVALSCALCLPVYLYVTFPYGVSLGLALAFIFLCLGTRSCLSKGPASAVGWGALAILVMVPMVWAKSTFLLAVIAFVIAAALRAFIGHRWGNLVLPIVLVVVYALVSPLPQRYMESHLGYDLGDGLPRAAWIAIGTSDVKQITTPEGVTSAVQGYGWWNRYALDLFDSTNNDESEMTDLSVAQVEENIRGLLSDPAHGLEFMSGKYVSEWDDPTFEALYATNLNVRGSDEQGQESTVFNPVDTDSPAGWIMRYVLLPLMDGTQTVVYALAALSLWRLSAKARPRAGDDSVTGPAFPLSIAAVMFLEGFAVYTLWEAKSQYTLPFYAMLIPLAAFGMHCLANRPQGSQEMKQSRRPPRHLRTT